MDSDLWTFPESVGRLDITGFEVEATDGSIGKVDESSNAVGESYLVVHTGVWKFGKTVILPAGLIERVDRDEEKLYLAASKEDIKGAPEYSDASAEYRSALSEHYLGRRNAAGGDEASTP